jgi:hypothetical protein
VRPPWCGARDDPRGRAGRAATPFLQRYHGHPDHYQNFTLTGHRRLFERAGFVVQKCAARAWSDLRLDHAGRRLTVASSFPRVGSRLAWVLFGLASVPLRFIDRIVPAANGHVLASSTFVRASVPAG